MAELKSTTIVPISFYCFILAVYFLSLAVNTILNNNEALSSNGLIAWTPVIASTIFAVGLVIVGMGILNGSNLCWKVLFFCLAICISSVASILIIWLVFLVLGTNLASSYIQSNQVSPATWFSFLGVFLSEIIVFYYLTREDMVESFGGMGEMISPF